ncbi:hypothetical protein VB773_04280 [Haloarculaceae archaeon H-GB2-1]|nr:hypothetical protein [Haloarculaceae archaeon H-GB1-1]MEA5388816.1 hypothetical protein [Haloarculaceae archaeon H-GB11]MEA5406873.1 hypothetical protein [Haloarculaceae archaeon H-GB2-1]
MEIEREALVEAGIGAGAVAVFVVAIYVISQSYATNGDLLPQGGLAIVGSIALFVVVLTLAGFWLEQQEF